MRLPNWRQLTTQRNMRNNHNQNIVYSAFWIFRDDSDVPRSAVLGLATLALAFERKIGSGCGVETTGFSNKARPMYRKMTTLTDKTASSPLHRVVDCWESPSLPGISFVLKLYRTHIGKPHISTEVTPNRANTLAAI